MAFNWMNKKQWLIIILVAIVILVFRLATQAIVNPAVSDSVVPSIIVKMGLTIPVVALMFLLTYVFMGIVFAWIQDKLPGTRIARGLKFGLAFGLIWAVYLLEPTSIAVESYSDTVVIAVIDVMAIVALGLLLGRLIASRSVNAKKACAVPGIMALAAIPVLYFAGRFAEYNMLHIYSVYDTMPAETLLWAAATGIGACVMYLLIRHGIPDASPLAKAAYFGLVIFGINLLVFNLFIPALFDMPFSGLGGLFLTDLFARTAIDVVTVTAGTYLFEAIELSRSRKRESVSRSSRGNALN